MASLSEIYGQITEADMAKEAEAAEAHGYVVVDEDTMEKAAHYDAIGRRLAHQVFAQQIEDPDLFKEAQEGGIPAALAAAAKAGAKGEEAEEEDEEEKKKKAKKDESVAEAMEEKKASVLQAMSEDDEYLQYILNKYVYAE